jgi:hypothetical protein
MFITENQNLSDSVLFLLSARQTLADIVEASGVDSSKDMVKFLHNEASDYEVMNLLILGKMPDEKYNQVAEAQLFSILKEQMLRDHELITEAIGNDIYQNVLHEVDSVFPLLSTTVPVLEFMSMKDKDIALAYMISEQGGLAGAAKGALSTAGKYWAGKAAAAKGAASSMAAGAGAKLAAVKAAISGAGAGAMAKVAAFALTPAGQAVGGAALAALIGYAAMKTYKNFLSKAARSCKGAPDKAGCMAKFKKQAIMKQASDLQRGASVCAKAKNPEKCKAGVARKIASLKAKAAKVA